MTPANHNFYLREFYHENKLARGQMTIGGVKLDLGKVKLPIYELCAKEDHIAPAKSVFIGSRLFGGPVTYVLAGSGHIAGVINPPGDKTKYQYWTNDKRAATLEAWIEGAEEHPGSWWPHYAEWLAKHSGDKVPARTPGAKLGAIEDAPGSYVKAEAGAACAAGIGMPSRGPCESAHSTRLPADRPPCHPQSGRPVRSG